MNTLRKASIMKTKNHNVLFFSMLFILLAFSGYISAQNANQPWVDSDGKLNLTINDGSLDHVLRLQKNNENGEIKYNFDAPAGSSYGGNDISALGNITVNSGTLKIVFTNKHTILLNGTIKVDSDADKKAELNIVLGSNPEQKRPVLKRNVFETNVPMITIKNTHNADKSNSKVTITGGRPANSNGTIPEDPTYPLIIDGGCTGYTVTASGVVYEATADADHKAMSSIIDISGGTLEMNKTILRNNWKDGNGYGSGMNICGNNTSGVYVKMENGSIRNCYSKNRGAAFYIDSDGDNGSSVVMEYDTVDNCYALDGGVIRTIGRNYASLVMNYCVITGNYSNSSTGTIHWNALPSPALELRNCKIQHNWTQGTGGGVSVRSSLVVENCDISYNVANGNGGGIHYETYSSSSLPNTPCQHNIISLDDRTTITHNTARDGAGVCMRIKRIKVGESYIDVNGQGETLQIRLNLDGTEISYNQATRDGGGIYMAQDDDGAPYITSLNLNNADFHHNEASEKGGGIYIGGISKVDMSGSVSDNTATNDGGGIYINSTGSITIEGTANIQYNNITSGQGGGVYQGGTMLANGTALTVSGNTKGTAKALTANNVYLPNAKTIAVGADAIATGIHVGVYTQNVAISGTDIPVLTGSATKLTAVYNALQLGTARLTDDRNVPQHAKYTSADNSTIYFALPEFDYGPFTKPFVGPISNADSLYKFMCWVNGVNGFTSTHASQNAEVTADINMSGIDYWIPIGELAHYTGTFSGNGHTISNLSINAIDEHTNYGVFGTITTNANISDVFVHGCSFNKNEAGAMGTIVGLMQGGTLKNCGGDGTLTAVHTDCVTGGLVGQVTGGTIHSSFAMPTMDGYQMGGLVGANSGNLYNSFANAQFVEQTGNDKYMGGLVGVNNGRVENCYSRVRGTVPSARFGYLAGNNTAATDMGLYYCYAPNATYVASGATAGNQISLDTYNPVVAPYLYYRSNDNTLASDASKNLLDELNRWVEGHTGYAPWKRTTAGGYSTGAGNINGDYPIHRYKDGSGNDMYTCVASTDGIALDYAANLDAMLTRHTSDATINLYANDNTSKGTGANEMIYIDEDVSLLQSTANAIAAYTGQTLKTYSAANGNRWHFLSSPLQESQIGISYSDNSQVGFSWASDPCGVQFSQDDDNALFPSNTPVSAFDLYSFYEPEYHWINFRRNSLSHWHENAHEVPIHYNGNGINTGVAPYNSGYSNNGNEPILVPGKGYLVSIDQEQLVQNKGVLNNGDVTLCNVTKTNFNDWAGLLGFNLLGNPYQSYLDFEKFINDGNGTNLWAGGGDDSYANTYATYDPSQKAYVQYTSNPSQGANTASQYIHPHQGFFVRMTNGSANTNTTTVTYTNAMRTNTSDSQSTFRGDSQPAYPLINLTVRDAEGNGDVAVLELGRDADEGAEKMRLGEGKGELSLGYGGKEYGILFRTEVADYQPLHFAAREAGTYTLTWEALNGTFSELTLVDNITGTRTDMLARESYVFEGDPSQYASRFKIMIGDYKDIEEHEDDGASEGSATFAFLMDGQLIVNGEGTLQVVDMLGRVVTTERLTGSQSTIDLTKATAGVYLLRLTDGMGTRVQKIVVS